MLLWKITFPRQCLLYLSNISFLTQYYHADNPAVLVVKYGAATPNIVRHRRYTVYTVLYHFDTYLPY